MMILTAGLRIRLVLCLSLLAPIPSLCGQQYIPLMGLSDPWRFNDSGRDLGTSWRAPGFNDQDWPQGIPLLGVETTEPFSYLAEGYSEISTPLLLTAPGSNTQTITYYFRARFHYPGTNLTGVRLLAHALIDDGAVLHLNGQEAARVRVSPGQDWLTQATPGVEGRPDSLELDPAALVPGENQLAVEVHQFGTNSTDVVFGLALYALAPQPLSILRLPESQTNHAGLTTRMEVQVTGGPASFQWRKDGVDIPGATLPRYTNSATPLSSAGDYSVAVTNPVSGLTSTVARLTVVDFNQGPRALTAEVSETANTTNQIAVAFTRKLLSSTVNTADPLRTNFTVDVLGTTNRLHLANAFYAPGTPAYSESYVVLRVEDPRWQIESASNHVVTIHNVRDTEGRVVPPGTQLPVVWPRYFNLVDTNALWQVHAAAFANPGVFQENWTAPDYQPGPFWTTAQGLFASTTAVYACSKPVSSLVPYQPAPTLFRTTFVWPTQAVGRALLRLRISADDAIAVFVNGEELWRSLGVPVGPLTPYSRSTQGGVVCGSPDVRADWLRPGSNQLAVAILQAVADPERDIVFGMQVTGIIFEPAAPPTPDPAELTFDRAAGNPLHLAWTGGGFALEATTNLASGPWLEVTNMSNPYTNQLGNMQEYFRLRR